MATGEWQPKHKTESTATLVAAGGSHSSTDKWTIHSAEAVCDSGGGKAARGRGRCLSASGGCDRRGAMPTSDEGKWLTAGVIHSCGPVLAFGPDGGMRRAVAVGSWHFGRHRCFFCWDLRRTLLCFSSVCVFFLICLFILFSFIFFLLFLLFSFICYIKYMMFAYTSDFI
jgi:hypothetical protein